METVDRITRVLRAAEAELRELMKQALAANEYQEVARIARAANDVAQLIASSDVSVPAQAAEHMSHRPQAPAPRGANGGTQVPNHAGRAQKRRRYPRFERDGEKLVKVGWSKKDRGEYEHRTTKDAVFLVALSMARLGHDGALFVMDDVVPVMDANDSEVPSYQVYLTLAWLRHLDAVEKKGKNGYAVKGAKLSTAQLEQLWVATTAR